MKISELMLRENFEKINEETLRLYYHSDNEKTQLFIYPKINAIMTKTPGKKVRKYLYTEYSVRGNKLKKGIIYIYLFILLHSHGMLASKKIRVNGKVENEDLIYPCNRKYRIFHFEKNKVVVLVKSGFAKECIHQEISFRKQNKKECILPILADGEGFYTETILNGVPLARIEKNYKTYEQQALRTIREISREYRQTVSAQEYARKLCEKITDGCQCLSPYFSDSRRQRLQALTAGLYKSLEGQNKQLVLGLSHGDLQPGNVWIERGTKKLYLIDWETWGIRSEWYDKAVLMCNIRNGTGIKELLEDKYLPIFEKDEYAVLKYVVSLEDLLYKVEEVNSLPMDFGVKEFLSYIHNNYPMIG